MYHFNFTSQVCVSFKTSIKIDGKFVVVITMIKGGKALEPLPPSGGSRKSSDLIRRCNSANEVGWAAHLHTVLLVSLHFLSDVTGCVTAQLVVIYSFIYIDLTPSNVTNSFLQR